jgi:hypothetical protein
LCDLGEVRVTVMAPLVRLTDVRAFVLHVGARYASRGVAARGRGGGQVRICVRNPLLGPRGWTRGVVRLCSAATATSPAAAVVPALPRALVKPLVGGFCTFMIG